jgi:hypothetical protein
MLIAPLDVHTLRIVAGFAAGTPARCRRKRLAAALQISPSGMTLAGKHGIGVI